MSLADELNARSSGFTSLLGLRFVEVSADVVRAEVAVGPHLHQPHGLVHGGVYASLVETLASVGASVDVWKRGLHALGLENATTFLKAVREGTLRARATPLHKGRRTQVWEVEVRDDRDRLVATGRVRLLCVEEGASVEGRGIAFEREKGGGSDEGPRPSAQGQPRAPSGRGTSSSS